MGNFYPPDNLVLCITLCVLIIRRNVKLSSNEQLLLLQILTTA